jgi:cytosine/adenosine deaminase-related metal-dependent hydrolase
MGARLGTIEPGKDADVVVWNGDPLELTSAAEAVFVRGVAVPMVSRQTLLRDRYLRFEKGKAARAPAYPAPPQP